MRLSATSRAIYSLHLKKMLFYDQTTHARMYAGVVETSDPRDNLKPMVCRRLVSLVPRLLLKHAAFSFLFKRIDLLYFYSNTVI